MENDSLIGKQLGAYLIQAKLGEGGMARVYKAYHARLRRDVAIKVILSQIADQAGFQARFEREAQLVASLEHPNIVAVYDFGEMGNLTYLVMQFVGGGTLRARLRAEQPLDPRRAAQYALQIARALHHAHLHGIVHRDVKPQNMLVSASDSTHLLLSDFGIAKLLDGRQETTMPLLPSGNLGSEPSLTNIGQIVGTADYIAPEQIQGKPVDARTDLYALGIVLYQMLTGQVPFHSTTVHGLFFQHVYTAPISIREVNPYVPEVLVQITTKAMAKAPEDRFQSAEAMAQALEAAISSYGASARGDPTMNTGPSPGLLTAAPLSHYRHPSSPTSPGIATGGQHSTGASGLRTIHPGGSRLAAASLPISKGRYRVSSIGAALLILLGLVVILARQHLLPWPGPAQQTTSSIQPFSESFNNNDRNWTIGNIGDLTAFIGSAKYTLTIASATQTYFPNPGAVGTLPDNFTLTAKIAQTQGGATIFYGIAFRLKQDGNNVYCYAFVIDRNQDFEVLKYDPSMPHGYALLWQGHSLAINKDTTQSNILQASVQSSRFSFEINNKPVQIGVNQANTTVTDTSYTSGQLALLVTGPDTSFTVSTVKLAVP